MNKSILIHGFAALVLLFFSGSCNKDNDSGPGFEMIFQENFYIPPGLSPFETHHFFRENIQSRFQQYLVQNGKTEDDIESILLEQGSLTGQFGDAQLEFIQEISVRIYDGIDVSDYIETGYRQPVPFDAGNTIGLIPTLANTKRFIADNRYGIDVVLRIREIPQIESEVRLDLKLKAKYK